MRRECVILIHRYLIRRFHAVALLTFHHSQPTTRETTPAQEEQLCIAPLISPTSLVVFCSTLSRKNKMCNIHHHHTNVINVTYITHLPYATIHRLATYTNRSTCAPIHRHTMTIDVCIMLITALHKKISTSLRRGGRRRSEKRIIASRALEARVWFLHCSVH